MAYLVGFHWGWLVAAAVIGLAMGWIAIVQRATGLSKRAMQIAAAVLVIAIGLSVSHQIPDRPGYWLDLGLSMLGVYLLGCAIGSWLRERVVWRTPPST
jgi:hypothetical protein